MQHAHPRENEPTGQIGSSAIKRFSPCAPREISRSGLNLSCFSSSHNFQLGANAPGVNSTAGARAAVHLAVGESVRIARRSHRTGLCLPALVRRVGQREQEAPKDVTSPRQTACQRESPAPQPERWHRDRHISHVAALSRAKYITVCGKVKQQLQGNVGADCRVMRGREKANLRQTLTWI